MNSKFDDAVGVGDVLTTKMGTRYIVRHPHAVTTRVENPKPEFEKEERTLLRDLEDDDTDVRITFTN